MGVLQEGKEKFLWSHVLRLDGVAHMQNTLMCGDEEGLGTWEHVGVHLFKYLLCVVQLWRQIDGGWQLE